jgi:hypothetical protein
VVGTLAASLLLPETRHVWIWEELEAKRTDQVAHAAPDDGVGDSADRRARTAPARLN